MLEGDGGPALPFAPGRNPRSGVPELRLVTCWPFDAVAPGGPQRFVLRAVREPALHAAAPARQD